MTKRVEHESDVYTLQKAGAVKKRQLAHTDCVLLKTRFRR